MYPTISKYHKMHSSDFAVLPENRGPCEIMIKKTLTKLKCTLCKHHQLAGTYLLDINMQDPGSPDPFPHGTKCTPWFFKMAAGK